MLYHGKRLILASDKPIPGEQRSVLFTLPLTSQDPDDSKLEYFTTSLIKQTVEQPILVTSPKNDALEFEHKAEGLGCSIMSDLSSTMTTTGTWGLAASTNTMNDTPARHPILCCAFPDAG